MGSSEERDVGAGYGQKPAASSWGMQPGEGQHIPLPPSASSEPFTSAFPPPFIPSVVIFVSLSPHHKALACP